MEENKLQLLKELEALEQEHNDLNSLIDNTEKLNSLDEITFLRFKKRKLFVKDNILKIKSQLYPNIIA